LFEIGSELGKERRHSGQAAGQTFFRWFASEARFDLVDDSQTAQHLGGDRLVIRQLIEFAPCALSRALDKVHARRPFFAMADLEENARRKAAGKKEIPLSPIAIEVVRRIDALFEIERSINGKSAEERLAARRVLSRPLVDDLHAYMRAQLARLARGHDLVKAINYILKRWAAFTLFLEDGRVCLSNNAAERGLRGIALGRKSWLFCGSDRGGRRAAAMYSLIVTAKMNGVDPQAWLTDVLSHIAAHPAHR
jgi:transposase